jgi:hypothetical protein
MINSLLYLTAMRPDIQFSMCLCTYFQASPWTSHRQAVKRMFKYLRYTPELGLWYSASYSLSLLVFSDANFGDVSVFWFLVGFLVFSQIVKCSSVYHRSRVCSYRLLLLPTTLDHIHAE